MSLRSLSAPSLWANPDFAKLWAAQTVSKFGAHITDAALAATAVIVLKADARQMGLLSALGSLPVLALSLLAGVWVDRLRRRPILIWTDLARGLILAAIPVAALFGALRMEQLYLVALLVGSLTVFFNVADASYLPALLPREQLIEGNSKIGASDSLAEIAGPALAGVLVQWFTAPFAIVIDSLTYFFSALAVGLIRKPEPPPAPSSPRQNIWHEMAEGLRVIARDPILRALAGTRGTLEFFGQFIGAVYWLLLVREWGLAPAWVGLSVGMGGVGALLGALLAERLTRRFGVGRAMLGAFLFIASLIWIVPVARGPQAFLVGLILLVQLVGDMAWPAYFINDTSLRQAVIPHHLLGRVNATLDFLAHGVAPLGALAAGTLGVTIGLRWTWLVGGAGVSLACLWLIFSPIRRLHTLPASPTN
jgi:MFS family permease